MYLTVLKSGINIGVKIKRKMVLSPNDEEVANSSNSRLLLSVLRLDYIILFHTLVTCVRQELLILQM